MFQDSRRLAYLAFPWNVGSYIILFTVLMFISYCAVSLGKSRTGQYVAILVSRPPGVTCRLPQSCAIDEKQLVWESYLLDSIKLSPVLHY